MFENKLIGVIEVIGTAVQQQLAVVFSKGGGAATEIDFGTIYYGQTKEISAYLVNNGPNKINYKFFFHPDKDPTQINENDSDFGCTPYEAGIEMSQRILSATPLEGLANPYDQVLLSNLQRFQLNLNVRLIFLVELLGGEKIWLVKTKSSTKSTQKFKSIKLPIQRRSFNQLLLFNLTTGVTKKFS